MASLADVVLSLVSRAKARPNAALDPETVRVLERMAYDDASSLFGALHAPVAEDTVEIHSRIAAINSESVSEPLVFERPVEILGFLPTLVDEALPAPSRVATLSDILVELKDSQRSSITQGQGSKAGAGSTLVTLASISILAPRLFRKRLDGPSPRLDVKFSMKLGANVYRDTRVSLAAFVRYL
jgi:hypothetical protein